MKDKELLVFQINNLCSCFLVDLVAKKSFNLFSVSFRDGMVSSPLQIGVAMRQDRGCRHYPRVKEETMHQNTVIGI
ncbi:hypothetical protein LWH94_10455, partial [Marinobacter sp. G11]|uniref:hypothetical protein n=1 Tax=Marinobacter sp. G11 TaxID=2903522 RepID=UPI001E2A4697